MTLLLQEGLHMESVHLVLQGLGICERDSRGMFTRQFPLQWPGGVWTLAKFEASLSSWWGVAAGWWAPLFSMVASYIRVVIRRFRFWGSNLRVRNPEISQVAKLSIQVHFLQEFQCCAFQVLQCWWREKNTIPVRVQEPGCFIGFRVFGAWKPFQESNMTMGNAEALN